MASSVDELLDALHSLRGFHDSVLGEATVDLLSHSLQCAHLLAAGSEDPELIVAGLFHDIGHGVAPGHQVAHGTTGAAFVSAVLGDRVARLVELHVPAKAYLVATDRSYAASLSAGSAASLELQRGVLSGAALMAFGTDPLADAAVALRRVDEAAKSPDTEVGAAEDWYDLVRQVAAR